MALYINGKKVESFHHILIEEDGYVGVGGNAVRILFDESGNQIDILGGALSYTGVYATIYVENGATSLDMPTAGTFVKLTQFTTDGLQSNMDADAANDQIVISAGYGGTFNVLFGISFSGTPNSTMILKLYKNNSAVPGLTLRRKLSGGGDVGRGAFTGIVAAVAGDVFDLRATGDGNGDDIVIIDANLTIQRIGK